MDGDILNNEKNNLEKALIVGIELDDDSIEIDIQYADSFGERMEQFPHQSVRGKKIHR